MAQNIDEDVNLNLGLAPHDPWVIKKVLSNSDLRSQLILPRYQFEDSIIPQMNGQVMIANLVNGVEVKIHIVEEGHEAPDYDATLIIHNGVYMLRAGWSGIVRNKGYKKDDVIGLMWDKWSRKFFIHHIQ